MKNHDFLPEKCWFSHKQGGVSWRGRANLLHWDAERARWPATIDLPSNFMGGSVCAAVGAAQVRDISSKMMNFPLKTMDFVAKTMNFPLKTMDFVAKTMNFLLKTMNCSLKNDGFCAARSSLAPHLWIITSGNRRKSTARQDQNSSSVREMHDFERKIHRFYTKFIVFVSNLQMWYIGTSSDIDLLWLRRLQGERVYAWCGLLLQVNENHEFFINAMNVVFKMMNFAFKMSNSSNKNCWIRFQLVLPTDDDALICVRPTGEWWEIWKKKRQFPSENDGFCSKNEWFLHKTQHGWKLWKEVSFHIEMKPWHSSTENETKILPLKINERWWFYGDQVHANAWKTQRKEERWLEPKEFSSPWCVLASKITDFWTVFWFKKHPFGFMPKKWFSYSKTTMLC